MNALWITRLCTYKNTSLSTQTAKILISVKIRGRERLMRKFKRSHTMASREASSISEVLLYEAREAKLYWKLFQTLLPKWSNFPGRRPRRMDITNRLLDLGYHHLAGKVAKILEKHSIPPIMGLLHGARTSDSRPLVYDLMEMFRAELVEAETLRYLRLKKAPQYELTQKDIAYFLRNINRRMQRRYYLRDFRQCHSYEYYMELQILKFLKAVNHKERFEPIILPIRNEHRCP